MPFCDVDKDVSLHYITNTPNGDATDLDHTKDTIILIPPTFCDVTIGLREQFKDPRLSEQYNLIAFDQRHMGSTKAPLSPERDSWVDAADLAAAHELLGLPPCHVFGVSINGCGEALRFAALFPSKCLSLCLCAAPVQAGEDPEWVVKGYHEIIQTWCFPNDLDTLEHACMEVAWFGFNDQIQTELQDEIVAWWQMNMPPTKRTKFLGQGLCALQRTRLSDEELGAIEIPTLFIQGDMSLINPPHKAQEMCDKLPNGHVFVVKGGPELLNFVPEYASVVNRVYSQFLTALPTTPPIYPPEPVRPDPGGACKAGLARLAMFTDDPSVAKRDPSTTLSFTRLSPEQIAQNAAQFSEFAMGESEAFHALNEQGLPIRKFSERHMDEWKVLASRRREQCMSISQLNGLVAVFHTPLNSAREGHLP